MTALHNACLRARYGLSGATVRLVATLVYGER